MGGAVHAAGVAYPGKAIWTSWKDKDVLKNHKNTSGLVELEHFCGMVYSWALNFSMQVHVFLSPKFKGSGRGNIIWIKGK